MDYRGQCVNPNGDPISIQWIVAPADVCNHPDTILNCHDNGRTIRAFIITNSVAAFLSLIIGCGPIMRYLTSGPIMRYLTRGGLGKRSNQVKYYDFCLPLGLQLLGNCLNAIAISRTPGYGHLKILNIFCVYLLRPRASCFLVGIFTALGYYKGELLWMQTFAGAATAEFVLLLLGNLFFLFTTPKDPQSSEDLPLPMFVALGFASVTMFTLMTLQFLHVTRGWNVFVKAWSLRGLYNLAFMFVTTIPSLLLNYVAFQKIITYAGNYWCPPRLGVQVFIWILVSTLGALVSAF